MKYWVYELNLLLYEFSRLEELLIKYPDEPIAWHRWVKISKEIGLYGSFFIVLIDFQDGYSLHHVFIGKI